MAEAAGLWHQLLPSASWHSLWQGQAIAASAGPATDGINKTYERCNEERPAGPTDPPPSLPHTPPSRELSPPETRHGPGPQACLPTRNDPASLILTPEFAALCARHAGDVIRHLRCPSSGAAVKNRLALPPSGRRRPGLRSSLRGREGGPAGRPAVRGGRLGTLRPVGLAPRPTRRPLAAD
ncbi:hypothetical protein SKAU_G00338150 [Synaphobranchus kaupii]|uniref:Uncharacterized protein n=1 Tax=Synaphobranchus kaupii TaxID=118154 RepID=A0A9Q1EME6_SYNKA|nr:hypothetical protein SKAU_G00338150 [Synaphobranchus kaupii]